MKQLVLSAFAGSLLLASAATQSAATQTPDADAKAWASHRNTRVLYAGWPGGSREKAFEPFLQQWFDTVATINLEKLSNETAKGYDVVIADWCSQYGNDGYPKSDSLSTPRVSLGNEFTKPVIAMDFVSSSLRRRHKLDWL
ncbi:MAG TPA: hypothetical protein VF384_08575 [Planctomycetota bacterium]